VIFFFLKNQIDKEKFQHEERKITYDNHWSIRSDIKNYVWYIYKNSYFIANGSLSQEIFINFIETKIKDPNVKSILEIGCGNGFNIFPLSEKFQNKKFTGVDISSTAIKNCEKKLSLQNNKNLSFFERNAEKLDFHKNSFDLIYTVLALEQMQEIKDKVIENINYISSGNIILIEPFKDVNKNFLNKFHMKSSNYLDLSYRDLNRYNLTIIEKLENFPQKVGLSVSCLFLKKDNQIEKN